MINKKIVIIIPLVVIFFGFYTFYFGNQSKLVYNDANCPFCNQQVLDYQQFYENDLVRALYTHKPVVPGHILIIPKRHVQRLEMLSSHEMLKIYETIQKVNTVASQIFGTSPYLILQKNGREAGQSVPHVHFHYIPKKENDFSNITFLIRFYIANFKNPIAKSEMNRIVHQLKTEMEKEAIRG